VAIVSLGCPKNLVDSERMLALLAEDGCLVPAPADRADVVLVNTCAFIAPAVAESMEAIREALEQKRRGRVRRVVVAGCLVNRAGRGLLKELPEIDALVRVEQRERIAEAVRGASGARGAHSAGEERGASSAVPTFRRPKGRLNIGHLREGVASDSGRFRLTPRHTAYLRISEGCSRRCAFCTIPAIRGPFRSKPPDMVLAEARELAADGAVELNVIGQDTTSYGADLGVRGGLARLLRGLAGVEGVRWVRLMYAHPRGFGDELIGVLGEGGKVVPYVDLPLQHVSDAVLRRMGRATTRRQIESLLERLRRRVAGLVLRTTFLVGFPGETDAQFAELLAFVRDFAFDAVGSFAFCAEPGTRAAGLDGQLPDAVKRRRREELMLAQQAVALASNRRRLGATLRVLVDGRDRQGASVGRYYGQAPEIDSICRLTRPRRPGTFVSARVVAADGYDLVVEPIRSRRGAARAQSK